MVNQSDRSVCGQGCDVERGQCGVVPAEIAGRGSETLHESPHVYARRGSRDETPLTESDSLRRPAERHVKPDGGGEVFVVGDLVVLRNPRTLGELGSTWTVTECGCELCALGGCVPVNDWLSGIGWRHLSVAILRRRGQPTVNELTRAAAGA